MRDRLLTQAAERLAQEDGPPLDRRAAVSALAEFDLLWQALAPAEQHKLKPVQG